MKIYFKYLIVLKSLIHIFFNFVVLAMLVFAVGCGNTINNTNYKIISENYNSPLYFSDVYIDTAAFLDNIYGLMVQMKLDFPSLEGKIEKNFNNANGYEVNINLLDKAGKPIKYLEDSIENDPAIFLKITKAKKTIQKAKYKFFFPYRKFKLPEGKQEIRIVIESYPINIPDDSTNLKSAEPVNYKRVTAKPDISIQMAQPILMPKLHRLYLWANNIVLDTSKFNPHDCDFALFGPGYPDLTWAVWAGDRNIYTSPTYTNQLQIINPHTTPAFYVSSNDNILFEVYDFDTFSKNDLMGRFSCSPLTLSHSINKADFKVFDKVKKMRIAAPYKINL